MGGSFFEKVVKDTDPEIIKAAWNKEVRQHTYVDSDYEDIYDGFSSLGGYLLKNEKVFNSKKEASDWVCHNTEKGDCALAVPFKTGEKLTTEQKKIARDALKKRDATEKAFQKTKKAVTGSITKKRQAAEVWETKRIAGHMTGYYSYAPTREWKERKPAEKPTFHACKACGSKVNLYYFNEGDECPICKASVLTTEQQAKLAAAKTARDKASVEYSKRPKDTHMFIGGWAAC